MVRPASGRVVDASRAGTFESATPVVIGFVVVKVARAGDVKIRTRLTASAAEAVAQARAVTLTRRVTVTLATGTKLRFRTITIRE